MAGINNTVRKIATKTILPNCSSALTTSTNYNEGDFLILSSNLIAAPVAESDGVNFIGVAPTTVVNGRPASPYVTDTDASLGIPQTPGPTTGDGFLCTAKSGDAFTTGCLVYLAPSTTSPTGSKNGVTITGSHAIGVYPGPAFTATGVEQIECVLGIGSNFRLGQ